MTDNFLREVAEGQGQSLERLAKRFGTRGRILWNWHTRGVQKGALKLEAMKLGRNMISTAPAVCRFLAKQNGVTVAQAEKCMATA
jgi:hypothetical protein